MLLPVVSVLMSPFVLPESASFQALVPSEVLSLVGAVLPGQPVLTLSPLMAGPAVLQTSPTPGTDHSLSLCSLL